jgi:hypothetical protein
LPFLESNAGKTRQLIALRIGVKTSNRCAMKALLPSPNVLLLLLLTLTAKFCRAAYVPEQVSIQIEVTLQKDPPSISLQWEHTPVAEFASSIPTKQFYVYRCDEPFNPSQDCFQDIQEITMEEGTNTYNFTDTNVQVR